MKMSLIVNALLLCLCLFLLAKLYVFPASELKQSQSLLDQSRSTEIAGPIGSEPKVQQTVPPILSTQEPSEIETEEPDINTSATPQAMSLIEYGNSLEISEQDFADIDIHLEGITPSNFEPPLADIEAHQLELEAEKTELKN